MEIQKSLLALFILPFILLACGPDTGSQKDPKEGDKKTQVDEVQKVNKSRTQSDKIIKVKREYKINPEDEKGVIVSEEQFDESGNRVKLISFDFYGSGVVDSETSYKFDAKGNRTEMSDGKTKTVTQYNEKGKRSKETWSRANGQGETEEFSYDEKGEWIESKYYDASGKYDFSRAKEITYDAKGNIVEEKKWEKYTDGTSDLLQFWIKQSYGENGKIAAKYNLRDDGAEYSREEFVYDGAGNLIAKLEFDDAASIPSYKESMEYNEYGEAIKDQNSSCNSAGTCDGLQYTNEYKYDDSGKQIRHMYVNEDGDAWGSRYDFEYYE